MSILLFVGLLKLSNSKSSALYLNDRIRLDVLSKGLPEPSVTSCYHLVTRLMRVTDSQQVVPTSLISSARNKLLTSCNKVDEANRLATSSSNKTDIV